ncbi:MAG: glycosyltransferase family 2 protein [Pikeienuella sp.]
MNLVARAVSRATKIRNHVTGWLTVPQRFRHVAGPTHRRLGDREVALIVLGRNAAFYLPELFRHHRALGVRHFVYVDNGSQDGSVEIASTELDTTVAVCDASFKRHQGLIRRLAATRFVSGGWRLVVDADELFDFPGSDSIDLPGLIDRLEAAGHTGLVAQMLDMVPETGLSPALSESYASAIAACAWYDLNGLDIRAYHDRDHPIGHLTKGNQLTDPCVKVFSGGIRRTLFGERCCLTKHPLFKLAPGVRPQGHPHIALGLRLADFTALLRHYKFAGDFLERERDLVARQALAHGEAALRVRRLSADPQMSFATETRRQWRPQEPLPTRLLAEGFLVATPAARTRLGLSPARSPS